MTKFVIPVCAFLAVTSIVTQRPNLLTIAVVGFVGWSILRGFIEPSDNNLAIREFNEKWVNAAETLGFDVRAGRRNRPASMFGMIDGHRANVVSRVGAEPEIEVRFESGFRSLDIDRRREGTKIIGNAAELSTGDSAFDDLYRISEHQDSKELRSWLTAERRDVLVTLGETLNVREIEEDELEVKLGSTRWAANDLVDAVRLCVLVAGVLDASYRPPTIQDAVIQDAVLDPGDR